MVVLEPPTPGVPVKTTEDIAEEERKCEMSDYTLKADQPADEKDVADIEKTLGKQSVF